MLTWDEAKRRSNLLKHGLDFDGCDAIWNHFTVTREDVRVAYGEPRHVCFGLLHDEVVVLVYTERSRGPHAISLRKAEKHEARYYRQVAKENLG
ncbi:BrnT family toxin [Ramlibacter sp.]|uniref:BrnT family toxin n=1 Tax=Ramlibacter sp. TaxID=1917967 RepID=UPI003D0C26D9